MSSRTRPIFGVMAKPPEHPRKPGKTVKSRTPHSGASRPEVQPIGPALAELLNPAINRGESGIGSSTGLQPPPDNSWDRRAGGEAAAHRARASTRDTSDDVAKRDAAVTGAGSPPPNPPPQAGEGQGEGMPRATGLDEAPQANYGTAATIPTLDPELAKQLGFTTEEEDAAALARPPRNKMEALGVAATADALEALIRDGRPEFKGEDGQIRIWTPHRPPRPEKSEGGVRFEIKSEYEPKGDQPTAIAELVEGIAAQRPHPGAARRHRFRQDLHHGQGDRGHPAPGHDPGAEQDAGGAALWRVQELLPRQRGGVFRLAITTTTSPRPMCRAPTPISRRIPPSTSRSTACATRRRGRCWSATTSSSWRRCRASTVSARSRPIPR